MSGWIVAWSLVSVKQPIVSLSLDYLPSLVQVRSVIDSVSFLDDGHGWKVKHYVD